MTAEFKPIDQFRQHMRQGPPWDSIVDFVSHPSFCGRRMYPRQMTLLKLIYLETEMMTDYDLEVIDGWRNGFRDSTNPLGVQVDIMDRIKYLKSAGYSHFTTVQMVLGRRASKGILGGMLAAERIAYLYSLGSWQQHYDQIPGQVAEILVSAPSLNLSVTRQFKDVRNTVLQCEYLKNHIVGDKITEFFIRTPGDEQTIAENKLAGVTSDREIASIAIKAATAASTSGRGGTGLMNLYDEFAHMLTGTGSSKTGEEIFDAFQPSLDQFGKSAMTYVASSPYAKIGKFYDLYQEGRITMEEYNIREGRQDTRSFAERAESQDIDDDEAGSYKPAEPTHLIVQLPSWELYKDWEKSRQIPMLPGKRRTYSLFNAPVQYVPDPDGTPDEKVQYRRKVRNPDKFKVERGGQFATVQNAYLDENMVDQMFERPAINRLDEVGNVYREYWRESLHEQPVGKLAYVYRAHADPSRTNANFGFCIGHLEDAPPDHNGYLWPHVVIDVLKVWKPQDYKDHLLDYVQIGDELDDYLTRFSTTKTMTYDQFQSAGFISSQKRKFPKIRVLEQTFTVQENQNRFESFKYILNNGWVHAYKDKFGEENQSLLELELKFLQEKVSTSGKIVVDKQDVGPVQTKDLADAVMVVTTSLLHDSLDRWHKGINYLASGSTNVAGLRAGTEQQRYQQFAGDRETSGSSAMSFSDPMVRWYAEQTEREERRRERARGNRENIERARTVRAQRTVGYRSSYNPDRTRGRLG